jgi:hypothetical protein
VLAPRFERFRANAGSLTEGDAIAMRKEWDARRVQL